MRKIRTKTSLPRFNVAMSARKFIGNIIQDGTTELSIVSCDEVVVAGTLRIVMMFRGNIGIVGE